MDSLTASSGLGLFLIGLVVFATGVTLVRQSGILAILGGVVLYFAGGLLMLRSLGVSPNPFVLLLFAVVLTAIGFEVWRRNKLVGTILIVVGLLALIGQDSLPPISGTADVLVSGINSSIEVINRLFEGTDDGLGKVFEP